jgi:CheY-like chemotaxis protein
LDSSPHAGTPILVIDDDEIMRELVSDWLEAAGYRVSKAGDCTDAVEALKKETPAVIVTDMLMPGPCGAYAIGELKKALPGVAVIAISGNFGSGQSLTPQAALAAGASRALAKPIRRDELLKAVAELARAAAT